MIPKESDHRSFNLDEEAAIISDTVLLQRLRDSLKVTGHLLADARAAIQVSQEMLAWFKRRAA